MQRAAPRKEITAAEKYKGTLTGFILAFYIFTMADLSRRQEPFFVETEGFAPEALIEQTLTPRHHRSGSDI